jgi:type I restriction enzyme S subunit
VTTASSGLFQYVRPRTPSARRVVESAYRLDASYFSHGAEDARVSLASSSLTVSPLHEVADVFALSDFSLRRIPATESRGVPFLTVSDILEWTPEPSMYLSRKYEPHLDDYIVKEGCILLSRSGTIGKTIVVGKELAGKAVANHAIRITPKTPDLMALIYLILGGQAGQQIVTGYKYGSVVGEVRPAQIEQIPIPIPSPSVRAVLRKHLDKALAAGDDASRLHQEAILAVLRANDLDDIPIDVHTAPQSESAPQVFLTGSRSLQSAPAMIGECRLDAHFYNPTAQLAIANIRRCKGEIKTVVDVTTGIRMSPLFVRKYVAKEHGVPYIAGKQISQIRPEFKYISRNATEDLEEHILHEGWTLVTCAGSVGKVGFVSGDLIGAAAQDVMRVIPDVTKVDGGYLNAWLASEYGEVLVVRCRYGSVVDRVSPQHVGAVLIPLPSAKEQRDIGDKVREAYEKRAEAIRLEDEAQAILLRELTKVPGSEGA